MNSLSKLKKIVQGIMSTLHVIFVIIMLTGAGIALFRPDLILLALDWIETVVKSWGAWNYLILFLVPMLESFPFVGVVFPGLNIMIFVGGFFIARQWNIFPFAALLAMSGACIGNSLGYFMGRYSGIGILHKYGAVFGIKPTQHIWLENQIEKNGFWFIVVGKFNNLVRSFIPYIAGAYKMTGKKFWIANILGSLTWAILTLLVGIFFIEQYEILLKNFKYILLGVIVVATLIVLWKSRKTDKKAL